MIGHRALLLLAAALMLGGAAACIHEYGTRKEAGAKVGAHYTYGYDGLDWANTFPACRGQRQSPLMLPAAGAAAKALGAPDAKSRFSYGTLQDAKIVNNGHTLQVSLPPGFASDVQIPIKGDRKTAKGPSILTGSGPVSFVKATPAQFHFHTHSEHIISGASYPLELHIVHFIKDQLPACGSAGCPAVLGVLLSLTDNEAEVTPELRRLVEAMPLNEGEASVVAGSLNVGALLPKDRSYFTYEGSLTTPPCTEGILWHVLTTPMKISQRLLTRYQEAVGDAACPDEGQQGSKAPAPSSSKPASLVAKSGSYFALPPKDKQGCVKLADGRNFRVTQPTNGRPIKYAV